MRTFLGLTLIEIMIAVLIVSIMAAVCLPIYSQHMVREKRIEAEISLTKLASALEEYYTVNHTYQNATLDKLGVPNTVANNRYQLIIESANTLNYSVAAKPISNQADADKECATLTLNALGGKGITGYGSTIACW